MKRKYNIQTRNQTCIERYSYEHHLQNPEIRKKAQKRYKYKDQNFDSSYELALFICLEDNDIDFEFHPSISFEYLDDKGKSHFYQPDFRIEGFLYELKGSQFISSNGKWINPYDRRLDSTYEAKRQCCLKHQVKILTSLECERHIKHVEDVYGKDYIQHFRNDKEVQLISRAQLNPMFRDRKLKNLPSLERNVYYKKNPELFLQLKELVEAWPKSYSRKLDAKGRKRESEVELPFKDVSRWINESLPQLSDPFYKTTTKVSWILHGLVDFPRCATCGSNEKFKHVNVNPFNGYAKHCSLKCGTSDASAIAKSKATRKEKYGDENFSNPLKTKQTMKLKLLVDPEFYKKRDQKIKATCMRQHRVDHLMKSFEFKKKREDASLKKFGKRWYSQTDEYHEKMISLNQKKHNKDWFVQTDEFKEKAKATWKKTLGVSQPSLSNEVMKKQHAKYFYDKQFFDSSIELAFYIWLQDQKKDFVYKPSVSFKYEHNGVAHSYFPDFKVEGKLVELKGQQFLKDDGTWQNPYDHSQDALYEAKHQCALQNNVKILYSSDYKKYVDYVKMKHGASFLNELKVKARA